MEHRYRDITEKEVDNYYEMWRGPRCCNCRFFDEFETINCYDLIGEDGKKVGTPVFWEGYCRKNSPKPFAVNAEDDTDTETRWPKVDGSDFCGEHEEIETTDPGGELDINHTGEQLK